LGEFVEWIRFKFANKRVAYVSIHLEVYWKHLNF
jgi:hypothetical protein